MRQFPIAVAVVWTAACIAAFFYSQHQGIPPWLLAAVLPALLVEIVFYLLPGFPAVRRLLAGIPSKGARGLCLAVSAIAPYLLVSLGTRTYTASSLLLLLAVVVPAAFWYVLLPPRWPFDLLFLIFAGAVYLAHIFPLIYHRPVRQLPLEVLGQLMWIRLGITVLLTIRRTDPYGFGFLPNRREWRIGALYYLGLLPAAGVLAYVLHALRYHPVSSAWWLLPLYAIAIFAGILWVVALAEEFFFRGVLQPLLARQFRSQAGGLAVTSLFFGLVHLPLRHFPNWKFALLAALAGIFYGLAFLRAKSVRASMVTHALTVTTWRLFFY